MAFVRAEPLSVLRARTSEKWATYPDDVLPLFVAEMDYPVAEPIVERVVERMRASDTGYVASPGALAPAFAGFAARRWGWDVDPASIRTTTDVSVAIVETLRQAVQPGDRVVIMPPVYPPFPDLIVEAGAVVEEVPLLHDEGYSVDLDGLRSAFAAGAKALLLCNPHNPVGLAHSRETLESVAELAAEFDAIVVSDEIHGALTHSGSFTPFLSVSDAARSTGLCVTSASKAFNLAGLKCALMVAASDRSTALLDRMHDEVGWRTSILGLHASVAAFTEGDEWLDAANAEIRASSDRLAHLLAERLPEVLFAKPSATYLAWLDFSELGWGTDPSARVLDRARVALSGGPDFGRGGEGFARLNLACSEEVLSEAIDRIARSV